MIAAVKLFAILLIAATRSAGSGWFETELVRRDLEPQANSNSALDAAVDKILFFHEHD